MTPEHIFLLAVIYGLPTLACIATAFTHPDEVVEFESDIMEACNYEI